MRAPFVRTPLLLAIALFLASCGGVVNGTPSPVPGLRAASSTESPAQLVATPTGLPESRATATSAPPERTTVESSESTSTPSVASVLVTNATPTPPPTTPTASPTPSVTPTPTLTRTSTPTPTLAPAPTPSSSSTLTATPTPTPTAIATEAAELGAICSFNEGQRRLSCHAEGQTGGQLKWTSNVSTKGGWNEIYEVTFDWGEFFNEIQVQVEECHGSSCSLATTAFDIELQPRGDCPADFTGWFTTFPLPSLSAIYEVGPPGRILTNDYKGHGYFRVPNGQNVLDVRMPIDATLYAGSVYLAPDEPQYLLFFRTACEGLWFLFDHIREPVPVIAELFTDDPPVGDSRTHTVGPLELKEGDLVGTSIGTLADGNAFVDFGVNDDFGRLPTPQHPNAHGRFLSAVCIYTFFDPETAAYLRSIEHPGSVAEEGLCP